MEGVDFWVHWRKTHANKYFQTSRQKLQVFHLTKIMGVIAPETTHNRRGKINSVSHKFNSEVIEVGS